MPIYVIDYVCYPLLVVVNRGFSAAYPNTWYQSKVKVARSRSRCDYRNVKIIMPLPDLEEGDRSFVASPKKGSGVPWSCYRSLELQIFKFGQLDLLEKKETWICLL